MDQNTDTVQQSLCLFTPLIDVKRHRGPFCGPTAIALLTGVPISRIERMIRRKRGGYKDSEGRKIAIRGTYPWEVTKVLTRLGCKVDEVNGKWIRGETLNSVVKDGLPSTGDYLIEVTGHFMVASGGKIADTAHHTPIAIDDYKKKTRRVKRVWKVVAPAVPKWTPEDDQKLQARAAERKALRDATKPPPKDAKQLKLERRIVLWERKAKRAATALRKLRAQQKRMAKQAVSPPPGIA